MVALERTGITSRCGTVTGLVNSRHRTGELPSGSEDSYGDARVWRFPLAFVLAPLPISASLLRFLARRRRKQRSPEVRLGDVRLVHAHNIAFVEVELIGVTVFVRQLGKLKVRGRQELVCDDRRTSTSGVQRAGWRSQFRCWVA